MRYLFFIFFTLILIDHDAYGQSWYIKQEVNWTSSAENLEKATVKQALSFEYAEYPGMEDELPVYTHVMEWQDKNPEVNVQLFSAEYQELPAAFNNDPVFSGLTEDIIFSNHISIARKNPYLIISTVPFRKNSATGRIERLTTFVLEIESVDNDTKVLPLKKSFSAENSLLSTGEWYKIRIPSSGIYKITFEQLKSMGMSDPTTLRIFGNGGGMLPEDIRKGDKNGLKPVAYYMNKGSDGIFNQGDFIIFYGYGVEKWNFDNTFKVYRCTKNHYSDFGYYFLTCNNGPVDIMSPYLQPDGDVTHLVNQYDYYSHHERNLINLINSGKDYYGEEFFTGYLQHDIIFKVPGLVKTEPVKLITNVLSRSTDSASFVLSIGNNTIETIRIRPANVGNYTAIFAYNQQKTSTFYSTEENIPLRLRYSRSESNAKGWLDFITLSAKAELRLSSDYLSFRNASTTGTNSITRFTVANAGDNVVIWDVTDPNNVLNMPYQTGTGSLSFVAGTDFLREFIAFRVNGSFPSPEMTGSDLGRIENQNLQGISVPELMIISHKDFLVEANRLAQHRNSHDGLSVYVASPEQIYNEFSSGAPDVTAIRNFVKHTYDKGMSGGGDELRYLLLFGGGSYDNKGVLETPGNYILTYQSDNSLSPVSSYVSDDFFALLDPGEQMFDGMLDIGVGRVPVTTESQAKTAVDKLIEYDSPATMGSWRNSVCFIGDDEDNNIHFNQANQLANTVTSKYPSFNVNKIFLDAYKKISTPVGQRYPDVKTAFNQQVSRGALIINYTGHGGVEGLAHEQILEKNDIINWRNKGKFPLFMTATCEFTRFDNPANVSAGQEVFFNPHGGGIALFTTTRLVYSGPNHVLNERFYEVVFDLDSQGNHYRLGDIMKYSKNKTGSGVNKRNFSLIGDPSMCLAYPKLKISTDSLNAVHISEPLDTLKALSEVTISGHIQDFSGNPLSSFNGTVYPIIYDKPVQLTTLANDGGEKKSFTLQNSILYRGKAGVVNGRFSFTFIVPKDINYAMGEGKLSYYGHDSIMDAAGSFKTFIIGGSADNFNIDNDGPLVDVYMNNENFRSGDVTNPNPILFVKVSDESGINTTGNGIGHDISAILNNISSSPFILNEYFEAGLNSYTNGTIEYPLFNLEEGKHVINVKVWDIHNNSGEGSVEFIVAKSENLFLNEIFNYPNPFNDITYFSFGHNKAGMDLDITVDIFDTNGELIKTIKANEFNTGFRSQPLEWNGNYDGDGQVRQGIYIYRISVKSSDGQSDVKSGKLMIIR